MTRYFLAFVAAVFGLFGLLYMIEPANLSQMAGLQANASGLTDIRATYGGFQLGFCFYLLWIVLSEQRLAGLVACALVSGFVAAGRILGLAVDGEFSNFHLIGLLFEIPILIASVWLYQMETRRA